MLATLGGDLSALSAEAIDAEAGAWMLPAVAVRFAPCGCAPRCAGRSGADAPRRRTGRRARLDVGRAPDWPRARRARCARRAGHASEPSRSVPAPRRAHAGHGTGSARPRRPTRRVIGSRSCWRAPSSSSTAPPRACSPTSDSPIRRSRSCASLRSRTTIGRDTGSPRSAAADGRRATTRRDSGGRRSPIRWRDCSPHWSPSTCSAPVDDRAVSACRSKARLGISSAWKRAVANRLRVSGTRCDHRDRVRSPAHQHLRRRHPRRAV